MIQAHHECEAILVCYFPHRDKDDGDDDHEDDHDDDGSGDGDGGAGDKDDDDDHMENNNRFWIFRVARRTEISKDILSLND